ncbi:MAG TPA: septum formation protein Maf [Deltaproteobacteria bacterium]|nr:MAG: septum formation protein Maf [Deltaproteobacteria bacterium GWC2_65_14]HBO70627.1 septum formation protein Maf [Deltaproteobacteria bacterium]
MGSRYNESPEGAPPGLILASSSPRRRELMRVIGVPFRVVPSRVEETSHAGEPFRNFVRRAAREKGEEVASRYPEAFVLAADTVVVVGNRMLGKPEDRADGARMLRLLQGREHRVHTAVCLLRRSTGYADEAVETTRVAFRSLTGQEIRAYLRTGESDDKAGAYAAQGRGNLLIERISGSYTNVVGLPMTRVLEMLQRTGMLAVSREGTKWYRREGCR